MSDTPSPTLTYAKYASVCPQRIFRTMHRNIAFLPRYASKYRGFRRVQETGRVRTYVKHIALFANCEIPSSTCPPSSRVSPICRTAEPYGQGNTRLSHIKRRRLIMPLVALVQKKQSAPATAYKFWCLGFASSSPLLLQFRLRKSECLYKYATNRQSADCFSPQLRTM